MSIFREITEERMDHERQLMNRYPLFNLVYNWVIAILIVALSIALISWGMDIRAARIREREAIAAEATRQEEQRTAFQAEQKKLAEARQAEAEKMERWADACAKMMWGVRNFRDKYHYDAADLETYLRCAWNRYLYGKKLTDLETIIFQPNQFLGCYKTGAATDRDKAFAMECLEKFAAEEKPECDPEYRWAELTQTGIYLVSEFGADGYARRWHA